MVLLGSVSLSAVVTDQAVAATQIRVVVNKEAVTSYQVQLRQAFLKLRRSPATAEAATNELIDEVIKRQEMRRRGVSVPDAAVDAAFANFAKQNKLSEAQLGQVFSQAGFTAAGFKEYIRVQMGWGQVVRMNTQQAERLSEQDVVQRMLQQGGKKPSTTEYMLQQVIFVVPEGSAKERRTGEANSMRQRFRSCNETVQLAQGLRDVTVRDLGRITQPELPPRWKDEVSRLSTGGTTRPQVTERGVEFIAVCSARNVSDDRAAQLVYQAQDLESLSQNAEPDAALLKRLRDAATIVRR
ncbi:peptidylprolyl isomerase [Aureimonas fodinaquatilis]|uniref:Peptidylprolyl isomerase n=2 Tax=Aureimonas fodinaquatilis TaxID=2565783 RepID=A0A5B0DXJ8_9HYPH|nr:peptidylprolyl isomerase [Aureimonas fodinaquatilis]